MICENCKLEIKEKYGSGRFCSSKCARCFSTKNIKRYKVIICKKCNNEFEVPKRSRKSNICDNCNKSIKECLNCNELFLSIKNKKCCCKKCYIEYLSKLAKNHLGGQCPKNKFHYNKNGKIKQF